MIARIVSGAQTGVDRGALDAAIEAACPYGGWVPKGRRSEDGCVPARYSAMSETASANYLKRTEQNVIDSTATVILCHGAPTGGTLRTVEFCKKHSRPYWIDDPDSPNETDRGMEIRYWIESEFGDAPIVLNFAGPRESKCPGIQEAARRYIARFLAEEPHASFDKQFDK